MRYLLVLTAGLILGGCYVAPYPRYRVREVRPPGLTTEEVVKLTKSGLSDDVVVEKIKEAGVTVRPTADQLAALKQEGVSDRVLQALVEAPITGTEQRVVEYVYYPRSYYYPYYYPYSYPYYWGYPHYYWGP
jgi:hypothetical protein